MDFLGAYLWFPVLENRVNANYILTSCSEQDYYDNSIREVVYIISPYGALLVPVCFLSFSFSELRYAGIKIITMQQVVKRKWVLCV